jgi:hypothetical protein
MAAFHDAGGSTDDIEKLKRTATCLNLELLARHPAVYLNDILPIGRSRAQYQALGDKRAC